MTIINGIDFTRCSTDYNYYATNLLRIKTINSEIKPLSFNAPQDRLHMLLERLHAEQRLMRVIVLKARREGISTYSEGRIFWRSHFNENTDSVVIAHEKDSGNNIFNMCKLFYEELPVQFRPMVRYSSKKELAFENPDPKDRVRNPGLRSSIEVVTAGKKNVARGAGYHNLHASELASWQFAEDVIPALVPTIPKTEQSLIIYESTAKGVGNFFHKEWLRAKEGDSNFAPFFLAWFDLPEYTQAFRNVQERVLFEETLNEEERELKAKHALTLEQLNWRRTTIHDLLNDVELFRQEYPSTDTEAFIVSGVPVFNRKRLRIMATKCSAPVFCGNITRQGLVPEQYGDLRVWRGPEKGATYVMGVDVADGGEGGDYSCVEVWKVLPSPYIAEQVAEWHGHIDPVNLAWQAEFLGRFYNNALAAVETNAHGLVTQQELYRTYWNIYQATYLDRYDNKLTKKLGWETTMRTKQLLVGFMSHCISDLTLVVHGEDLVREMMTFIRDASGSANASSNGHDDRVMAAMIGVFTLHQSIDADGTFETASSTADPAARIIQPPPNYIDPEFAFWQKFGHPTKADAEDCWLNY